MLKKRLAALENTDLPANDSGVSGMCVQVRIIANFSLKAIKLSKLKSVIGHLATLSIAFGFRI